MKCCLCLSNSKEYFKDIKSGSLYFKCTECALCFLDPSQRLNHADEKARYETHENDINDPRYQNFVKPLFDQITSLYSSKAAGLDFGCGEGPVLSFLLSKQGYKTDLYDPYFKNDMRVFEQTYDYIFAIEVFEHLYDPRAELKRLRSMLNENGSLFIMTEFLEQEIDFTSWYYRKDPTHVCFYSSKTFEYIKETFKFSKFLKVDKRIGLLRV